MSFKRVLFFAVVDFIVLFSSSAVAAGPYPYDPNSFLCCYGTILTKPTSTSACCGSAATRAIYDTQNQLCCNGKVVPKPTSTAACCAKGYVTFNPQTQKCCDSVVQTLNPNIMQACCGTRLFNLATELCCYGKVFAKSTSTTACCGSASAPTTYDTLKQKCCNNTVVQTLNLNIAQDCCGKTLYNVAGRFCCYDSIFAYHPWFDCCGSATAPIIFNSQNRRCCNGAVVPNPTPTSACCAIGTATYDVLTQRCCDGVPVTMNPSIDQACCGTRLFSLATQLCCYGKVMAKLTPYTACCGSVAVPTTYDTQKQLCCNGKVVHKPTSTTACCGNGTATYDKLKQFCCDGVVKQPNLSISQDCCGKQLYSPTTQLCCADKIYVKPTPTSACCGIFTYDTLTKQCCT